MILFLCFFVFDIFTQRWFRILALPVVGIIYWVGLWNLLNLYVLPEYGVPAGFIRRDGLYILVGTIGNLAIKLYWPPRVFSREGESFQWRHQLIRFLRLLCVVSLGVVFWTGAWNFIDTAWYESTRNRELVYIVIAIPILFFLDVVFSSPALRHMLALQMDSSIYDDDNIFSVWN